jgi:hypothetical protein
VSDDAATLLVAGSIGAATAHEFLVWVRAQQLPDPEQLLADPDGTSFAGMRPDRVFAVLSAVLSAVVSDPSPQRWSAGVQLCSTAAAEVGVDPAVPVVRALLRPGVRPAGTPLPAGIVAFAAPLALAGMLEPPAA